jgi:hypothetical protein
MTAGFSNRRRNRRAFNRRTLTADVTAGRLTAGPLTADVTAGRLTAGPLTADVTAGRLTAGPEQPT